MEKKGAGKDKNSIDRLLQDNNNLKNGLKKILQAFERDSVPMKPELTNVPDPNIIEKKTIQ